MKRHSGGVTLLLLTLSLSACTGGVRPDPPEYRQHFTAPSDALLGASMAALADREMVIVYGDQALGEVRAHYAARIPYTITARVETKEQEGSTLSLTGRRGSAAIGTARLSRLATDIAGRLKPRDE